MPHSPRIYFDDLVVSRESWSLPAAEVEWTRQTDEAERFLAARRWQRRHGMPRVVFVKLPTEVKPFYVDFDSPAYVAGLGRAIEREVERGGGGEQVMSVTEMLPGVEQAWLRDGEGRRYTSELRIVAVDLSN
jgi:aspartyl/asparaginyl-tRNA synthetase